MRRGELETWGSGLDVWAFVLAAELREGWLV